MRRAFVCLVFGLVGLPHCGPRPQGIRFWNLRGTRSQVFRCRRRGKTAGVPTNARTIGMERLTNDERLRITDSEPGRYDVKLADKIGGVCIVRNVEVEATDGMRDASLLRKTLHLRPGQRKRLPIFALRMRCRTVDS
jgi:hypothetical protein